MRGEVEEFLEEFEFGNVGLVPGAKTGAAVFEDRGGMFSSGVYALTLHGEIIYVGKAKVVIQRIYAHWNAMCRLRSGKPPFERGPQAFVFTGMKLCPCSNYDLDRIEKQMIARYRPKHNTRLVPKGRVSLEEVGFDFIRFGIANVVETPVYRRRIT